MPVDRARVTPCLFGLYSVVASLYNELPTSRRVGVITWPGKTGVTFPRAEGGAAVALGDGVLAQVGGRSVVENCRPRCARSTALAAA